MKKIILITVFCLLVTCPVCANEIGSTQSIEGTVWGHYDCNPIGCGYSDRVGFYDGFMYNYIYKYNCLYTTAEFLPAAYLALPGIGFFSYKAYCSPDNPLICQRQTGVLFPSTGKGIRSCGVIPCPRRHTLELVSDMSLPNDICPKGIRESMMTRDPQMDSGCYAPIPADRFYDHDKAAYCWVFFIATLPEDEYRCLWYKPDGELYHEESFQLSHEAGCWYASIPIKGDTPAATFGEWHVDVYLNGNKEFRKYFTIVASDYEYIELLPSGLDYFKAAYINDSGVVVGSGHDGATSKGFIYNDGEYTELLPPEWDSAYAISINDSGVVLGTGGDDKTRTKGFLYSKGQYTELLPPGWGAANPQSINNRDEVVGYSYFGTDPESFFLYSEGQYTELLPPGWQSAQAYCINDSGVVVGGFSVDLNSKGFIFSAGKYTELIPPGWEYANATSVNDSGVVIGSGYDGTTSKGFIYSDGEYTELIPPGWEYANATAINDSGVVIGEGSDGTLDKGFVYSNGKYTELFPPWSINTAVTSINNSGVVVGWGTDSESVERGFIALPKF